MRPLSVLPSRDQKASPPSNYIFYGYGILPLVTINEGVSRVCICKLLSLSSIHMVEYIEAFLLVIDLFSSLPRVSSSIIN